jgi:hypothetical protein
VIARPKPSITGRIDDRYRSIAVEFGLKNPITDVNGSFTEAAAIGSTNCGSGLLGITVY